MENGLGVSRVASALADGPMWQLASRLKPTPRKWHHRLLVVYILLLPLFLTGQNRATLELAQREYDAGQYAAAVRTLRSNPQLTEFDPEAALLLAVSLFHANDLRAAQERLDLLIKQRGDAFPVARFYLGRVYHAQGLFTEAAAEYKRYLRTLKQDGQAWLAVTALLRNVANGLAATGSTEQTIVDNLGPEVNSEADEFGPIPSPTGSGRVYFTRAVTPAGSTTAQTDIAYTAATGISWAPAAPLSPLINTRAEEALLDISPDGRRLYYFRGTSAADGSFLVDTFRTNTADDLVTIPVEVPLNVNTTDVTPFFGADDAIYFASNRPDGYGGLDLYRRLRLPEGGYGPSQNLGPQVNGPYDEACPFVARDGRTIYFSTNDPEYSIGGFDVVKSFRVVGVEGRFTRPENVGLSVNSAGDDTHFRLAPDGFTGFLASDRKDGFGGRDLFVVYYASGRVEMLGGE